MRKSNSFGSKITDLADILQRAVDINGVDAVLATLNRKNTGLSFDCIAEVMPKVRKALETSNYTAVGTLTNALEELFPKKTRTNKYAQFSKIGQDPEIP